jgi:hypothetical protein
MKAMKCWVLLSEGEDRMIRVPDTRVEAIADEWRGISWVVVIGRGLLRNPLSVCVRGTNIN